MASYDDIKPLLVSSLVYSRMTRLLGETPLDANHALTRLMDMWEAQTGSGQPVSISARDPLSIVSQSAVLSAIIEYQSTRMECPQPDSGRPLGWNSVVAWLADNLVLWSDCDDLPHLRDVMHGIPEADDVGGPGVDGIGSILKGAGATVRPAGQSAERGWTATRRSGVDIRSVSAPQALRILRGLAAWMPPYMTMTLNIEWSGLAGAAYPGRHGIVTLSASGPVEPSVSRSRTDS